MTLLVTMYFSHKYSLNISACDDDTVRLDTIAVVLKVVLFK